MPQRGRRTGISIPSVSGFRGTVLRKDDVIAVEPHTADGKEPEMQHWDPDCWVGDDT